MGLFTPCNAGHCTTFWQCAPGVRTIRYSRYCVNRCDMANYIGSKFGKEDHDKLVLLPLGY